MLGRVAEYKRRKDARARNPAGTRVDVFEIDVHSWSVLGRRHAVIDSEPQHQGQI